MLLPCGTDPAAYDALLDEEPSSPAYQAARDTAVQLCTGCPSPCPERITPGSEPRTVQDFDDSDWIPAPAPVVLLPVRPTRRRPRHFPPTGRDYVRPERRPAVWASMAAELAAEGRSLDDIAAALCVSEETVTALLAQTISQDDAAEYRHYAYH
ncbi:hypothetical protein [Kitasatospora viridis]|uniref:Uncharacterized protein n=1 Tax=Kitasatospora viridis TaxID=281105 RepID=A0A561UKR3_9ACTN|nr:hypothetical protein [Kitasatospora viridis]TWF99935.1 hypothetical protein FHX73_113795 [Kitasatospora viridis]